MAYLPVNSALPFRSGKASAMLDEGHCSCLHQSPRCEYLGGRIHLLRVCFITKSREKNIWKLTKSEDKHVRRMDGGRYSVGSCFEYMYDDNLCTQYAQK